MILQYVFVKNYRAIVGQGFNFSSQFSVNYNPQTNKLAIIKNTFFIEGFYGGHIKALKGLIGENGAGKTTILNFIKEILCFPVSEATANSECILVYFNKKEFTIHTLGYSLEKKNLSCPKGYSLTLEDIRIKLNKRSDSDKYRNSILGFEPRFSREMAIIYLSNIFDARAERDYGPKIPPIVFNLSVNTLVKGTINGEENVSTFKYDEINKAIKLVLNFSKDIFSIKLPKSIRVNFKSILISEFISDSLRATLKKSEKSERADYLREIASNLSAQRNNKPKKRERIEYFLGAYLFVQLVNYCETSRLEIWASAIKKNEYLFNEDNIITFFRSEEKYLARENINDSKEFLDSSRNWLDFILNYSLFIKHTLELFDKNNDASSYEDFFDIPLESKNENIIRKLIELSEESSLKINLLSFTWRDMSTGETMLLRFFSNLYYISNVLKKNKQVKFKRLLFLFDELETFYHPQWQRKIVKSMLNFINENFSGFESQIVFTSHSPLTISDIPKTDLVFLKKEGEKIIVQKELNDHKQTFAANVHTLLTDSFFLQNGLIGEFANEKINEVIELLLDKSLNEVVEKEKYIESFINIIGEEVIKAKLLTILENRLRSNLIEVKSELKNMKLQIARKKR